MSLTITVNSQPLREVLDRLYAATDDLSPVMSKVGMTLEDRIRERFETLTDPLGVPWSPWKPSTFKNYPKGGKRHLLNRVGDLIDGISHQFDATSATVGFDMPYAAHHERGTKNMARRGLLFADPDAGTLAPDDERALIEIVTDVLNAALD